MADEILNGAVKAEQTSKYSGSNPAILKWFTYLKKLYFNIENITKFAIEF